MNRCSLRAKGFQAYTLLRFYIEMNEKWLYGPGNFPGLSRNGPLDAFFKPKCAYAVKPEVPKSWSLEMDYSRAPCLGPNQKTRGLWERDWSSRSLPQVRRIVGSGYENGHGVVTLLDQMVRVVRFSSTFFTAMAGNKAINLVPWAHVSFGQRQDTELWNNPFQESKILGLPVSRSMRALALKRRPEVKSMWIRSTKAFNTHSHRLYL